MKTTTINIIGCGKLGKTIGKLIKVNQVATIQGVLTASKISAQLAVDFIGEGVAYESLHDLPAADITFVTTRDDIIKHTADQLHAASVLKKGSIVLHCSGSLTSDALLSTRLSGCNIASIHPIKSFANPEQAVNTFAGTYCAMEGDVEAIHLLSSLFEKIGAKPLSIEKRQKKIYHSAGVIANNYLVTLHHHATQCYVNTGIEESTAKNIASMLMNDALNNLKNLSHEKSLTGPIQRGDVNTIRNHRTALENNAALKQTKDIYVSLGLGTIPLTNHSAETKSQIEDALLGENITDEKSNANCQSKAKL